MSKETKNQELKVPSSSFCNVILIGILYIILGFQVWETSFWGLGIILFAVGWIGLGLFGILIKLVVILIKTLEA